MKAPIMFCVFFMSLKTEATLKVGKTVRRPGTFVLGSLNQVHEYRHIYYQCGKLSETFAILSEAHLFSVDYVNKHMLADKNYTIGSFLADTCYSEAVGLQNTVNFIDAGLCHSKTQLDHSNKSYVGNKVQAVTGTFCSGVGKYVNYLLDAYCIPLIGAQSSATEFDTDNTNRYFLRAVASDSFQVQALYDILVKVGWTQVAVLFEDYTYGRSLKDNFQLIIENQQERVVCVRDRDYKKLSYSTSIKHATSDQELRDYLNDTTTPRVIILFANFIVADHFFQKIYEWGFVGRFQLLGVDGWGSSLELKSQVAQAADGAITTEQKEEELLIFREHLDGLTLGSVLAQPNHNSYLTDLFQIEHNCTIESDPLTTDADIYYITNTSCDSGLRLKKPYPPGSLRRAQNVFKAVSVIAQGIINLQEQYCPGSEDVCERLENELNGTLLYESIKNASVHNNITSFSFVNGSGPPTYWIMQYSANSSLEGNWNKIGIYDYFQDPPLTLNGTHFPVLNNSETSVGQSCRPTCNALQKKEYTDNCCYKCRELCDAFSKVIPTGEEYECKWCADDEMPNAYRNACVPVHFDLFHAPTAPMGFVFIGSCLGCLLTLVSASLIYCHRQTPMVLAADIDLVPYFALTSFFICSSPPIMIPSNSATMCTVSWVFFSIGIGATQLMVLAKSVRLACKSPPSIEQCTKLAQPSLHSCLILAVLHFILIICWISFFTPSMEYSASMVHDEVTHSAQCTVNWNSLTMLGVVPASCSIICLYFLRRALQSSFAYVVHQSRYVLCGILCLVFSYIPLLIELKNLHDEKDQKDQAERDQKQAVIVMCLSLITGLISWMVLLLPVTYELIAHRKQNVWLCVNRERARLYTEGSTISMISSVSSPTSSDPQNSALSTAVNFSRQISTGTTGC